MKEKLQFFVREYFTERGGYDVIHISKAGTVYYRKSDDEIYNRHKSEGRLEKLK